MKPVALDKIPDELKKLQRWVVWRIVTRDGKPTKVPIDPRTGENASCDNPRTWSSYEKAVEAYKRRNVDGIGFMLGLPYVGVDLDKCRDPKSGEIEPWAFDIVEELDSYTEISPSGRGLHVILRGQLPPGGRRKGPIEMYDSKRYFTVTGDKVTRWDI